MSEITPADTIATALFGSRDDDAPPACRARTPARRRDLLQAPRWCLRARVRARNGGPAGAQRASALL